jgi:hypothetical protein
MLLVKRWRPQIMTLLISIVAAIFYYISSRLLEVRQQALTGRRELLLGRVRRQPITRWSLCCSALCLTEKEKRRAASRPPSLPLWLELRRGYGARPRGARPSGGSASAYIHIHTHLEKVASNRIELFLVIFSQFCQNLWCERGVLILGSGF